MSRISYLSAFAVLPLVLLSACSIPSGQPQKDLEVVAPNQVVDFGTLYAQNCSACHGAEGRGGASIALANPVYLAIVDENAVHKVVANGVRGTSMPAFAQSAGGLLTDEQIDVITRGIFSRWGHKGILDGTNPPSYAAKTSGDAARGETVSEHIAHPVTDLKVMEPKPVPSATILFLRWSAIRDCARS